MAHTTSSKSITGIWKDAEGCEEGAGEEGLALGVEVASGAGESHFLLVVSGAVEDVTEGSFDVDQERACLGGRLSDGAVVEAQDAVDGVLEVISDDDGCEQGWANTRRL